MVKHNRIDRLAIDEEKERLNRFFEILLRVDLRTIERLGNEKENNNDNDKKYVDKC